MADENKTFEPTPKKIEDTRKKGNVPKSQEFSGFTILFLGLIIFIFIVPVFSEHIKKMFVEILQFDKLIDLQHIDTKVILSVGTKYLMDIFGVFILFSLFIMFFAVVANVSQFGFLVTKLKFDIKKINPINGFKNIFSFKKIIEYIKMFLKLMLALALMVFVIYYYIAELSNATIYNPRDVVETIMTITYYLIGVSLLIVFVFAIIDLVFVRYNYFKQLKMSFQEVKDEYKQMEGSPEIKQRIKEIQRKMASGSMLNNVKDSKFVVTNPTHYAVAIKYEAETDKPPIVVAKGIDMLALKIKERALEHDIPIIENPPLARALHKEVEIDKPISEEFYESIIDLLLYVEKLDKK